MAKSKKGDIRKNSAGQNKKDIREKDFDFMFFATEFKKLLEKEYKILLDNGKVITVSFDKGNFYHLLGFHKFENVVFYGMIHDEITAYTPQNFFDDVYAGKIWYGGYDHNKIVIPEKFQGGTFVNSFKEHELTPKTRHTLEQRFPFFSYDEIIKIFENKDVVKFERDKSNYNVRATKILFHFISEKNRNLNIFIDEENGENCFVTSFYLENQKNIYRRRKDGTQMDKFRILSLYIEEKQNHQPVKFAADWVLARNLNENNCTAYDKVKSLLKKGLICTKSLNENLDAIIKRKNESAQELAELEKEKKILNLQNAYIVASDRDKDEYALMLMDYEIDAENLALDQEEIRKKSARIRQNIKATKKLFHTLAEKEKLIFPLLSGIEELDKGVLKEVYVPLIDKSKFWKEEFWDYFIHNFDYLRENITPRQLSDEYKRWRENS